MTSAQDWRRLEELFHAALELESAARAAFIERECADSPELREELERLLTSAEDDTTLDGVVAGAAAATSASLDPLQAGEALGSYRLLEVLGRGGLSTVYLAERADDQYLAQAALKIVSHGMDSKDLQDRLRQERQILASLDHPNIARLLDGGTTRDGQPFFVMEYIEGQDLESYCDSHQLSVEQRLRIFRQVCDAVNYAHRNLIVHRDIKPGNILVTDKGVPKLLDFGIAKILDPEPGLQLAETTLTGRRLLTPQFASPEQMRGEALTTATDVYSLGVVLYRLLTGRHPYVLTRLRPSEVERMICETEAERPSSGAMRPLADDETWVREALTGLEEIAQRRDTTPQRLKRQLEGDLDTIVLKALRKEPERRYSTPDQLSEDLRCYLEGLPVTARADSAWYRSRKFMRRHRMAAATVVMMAAVVASLVGFYTLRLAQERDKARVEAGKAQQAYDVLRDVFDVSNPSRSKGETVTARELLDRGAERMSQELTGQPEVRASMLEVIGGVYRQLGLSSRAETLLQESLEIRRDHFDAASPEVAASLNQLAEVLYELKSYDRAEAMFREALAIRTATVGEEDPDTLVSQNNLAAMLFARGDFEGSEEIFRQVLATRRRSSSATESEVATSLNNLALVLDTRGDLQAAEPLYRESLEIKRRIFGSLDLDVASGLNNLAGMLEAGGDDAAAAPLYQEALEIYRQLVGDAYPDVTHSLQSLAEIALRQGDSSEAERLFTEALTSWQQASPDNPGWKAKLLGPLGELRVRDGRATAAEPLLRESLTLFTEAYPADDWQIGQAEVRLGACLLALGRSAEGEALIDRGLAALETA
ncbi:MAG: serine/threonine-protein kinase, partial [Acidobacteriota bacterium]